MGLSVPGNGREYHNLELVGENRSDFDQLGLIARLFERCNSSSTVSVWSVPEGGAFRPLSMCSVARVDEQLAELARLYPRETLYWCPNPLDPRAACWRGVHHQVAEHHQAALEGRRMWHERRNRHVLELATLTVDLDCYQVGLELEQAEEQLAGLVAREAIPAPAVLLCSGRGLYLVYALRSLDGQPPVVTERTIAAWGRAHAGLHRKLAPLGYDGKAKAISNLYKVPGTTCAKSGHQVRPRPGWEFAGKLRTCTLEALADWVSPLASSRITAPRAACRRRPRRKLAALQAPRPARPPARGPKDEPINPGTVARHQIALDELEQLFEHREGMKAGHRVLWLLNHFRFGCWLLGALHEPAPFYQARRATRRFAKKCKPVFPDCSVPDELERRVFSNEIGWNSLDGFDPRRFPRGDRLALGLGVTPEEARELGFRFLVPPPPGAPAPEPPPSPGELEQLEQERARRRQARLALDEDLRSTDAPLSELAARHGCSRQRVWARVQALEARGERLPRRRDGRQCQILLVPAGGAGSEDSSAAPLPSSALEVDDPGRPAGRGAVGASAGSLLPPFPPQRPPEGNAPASDEPPELRFLTPGFCSPTSVGSGSWSRSGLEVLAAGAQVDDQGRGFPDLVHFLARGSQVRAEASLTPGLSPSGLWPFGLRWPAEVLVGSQLDRPRARPPPPAPGARAPPVILLVT